MNRVRRLSNAAKLNVAGHVLTAAGMPLQIAGGSKLYPSLLERWGMASVTLVAALLVGYVGYAAP